MRHLSKLAPFVAIGTILFLLLRGQLVSHSPIVIALQLAAVVLAVSARRTFAPGQFRFQAPPAAGGLITGGPYRFIRHPMYAATGLLIVSGIASHWSAINALAGLVYFAVLAVRIAAEEKLLRQRYPEYADYARRTKRLVPFVF